MSELTSMKDVLLIEADRLEGWAEDAERKLRQAPPGPEETKYKNLRDNYRRMAETIRKAVKGIK